MTVIILSFPENIWKNEIIQNEWKNNSDFVQSSAAPEKSKAFE